MDIARILEWRKGRALGAYDLWPSRDAGGWRIAITAHKAAAESTAEWQPIGGSRGV